MHHAVIDVKFVSNSTFMQEKNKPIPPFMLAILP